MRVSFEGECTVARAEDLKSSLLDALQTGEALELDFQGVTRIDLAFCQLIHAVRSSCRALGIECLLVPGLPGELAHVADRCGLPELAGSPAPGMETQI